MDWYEEKQAKEAREAALLAWRGLTRFAVDREGNLYGVCRGSGFSFSRRYYRSLSWNLNDTHGIGIVVLAGTEVLSAGGGAAGDAAGCYGQPA